MKLLFFDDWKLGVLKGNAVVDVSAAVSSIPHTGPHDLLSGLIARFAEYKGRVEEAAAKGQGVPLGQVRVRPPVPRPVNIVAMAVNYMEDGTRSEPAPINAFHKSPSAVTTRTPAFRHSTATASSSSRLVRVFSTRSAPSAA